jgi:hypothetical protein
MHTYNKNSNGVAAINSTLTAITVQCCCCCSVLFVVLLGFLVGWLVGGDLGVARYQRRFFKQELNEIRYYSCPDTHTSLPRGAINLFAGIA